MLSYTERMVRGDPESDYQGNMRDLPESNKRSQ